ncbi:NAD(P)-bd_dom domain-containing protein [Haematococcus lacustris]|uniref:NAD(P)-bd_dom domain-containing protein n=1 Tax=Haematococcus lacustris TaxID=44745 RepID=A0A6A0AE96_HAELA|nr:NAD(P)-bd_dom domain-containing protein [Haematococcus lacustris]
MQRSSLPMSSGLVELVRGDVFQFASLPGALGDAGCVVCATGASGLADPLGPFNVDYQGTANLVAAAKQQGVKKFVLVTSIGADDLINPLNLFYGVLFWKKRGEEVLQRSSLDYTIIRPGGLKNQLRAGEVAGNVAEVCVAALSEPAAANKVVEVIATPDAPALTYAQLFASVGVN